MDGARSLRSTLLSRLSGLIVSDRIIGAVGEVIEHLFCLSELLFQLYRFGAPLTSILCLFVFLNIFNLFRKLYLVSKTSSYI